MTLKEPSRRRARAGPPSDHRSEAARDRSSSLRRTLDHIDARITGWLASYSIGLLRVSLGLIFLWFGALKFVPELSPAQDLAGQTIARLTFGLVAPAVSIPLLAVWECLIGLGLVSGRWLRATLLLLVLQMVGTVMPLILFPSIVFTLPPLVPTLEGQYIIKNIVLVCAALVLGATVRGGRLTTGPRGA
jgi:uncharacterized membrane protein YphA (DoxX/SURF4 family)